MKVTTDACLLGAWADVEHAQHILDIGTGSGLLALFAAQRSSARIDAVELAPEAAAEAAANFAASPWGTRLHAHAMDIRDFEAPAPFDVILCNPPFFTASTENRDPALAMARHDTTLPLHTLLETCSRLLSTDGKAYLLLPVSAAHILCEQLSNTPLSVVQKLDVISQPGDDPHRQILVLGRSAHTCQHSRIILYRKHPLHTAEAGKLFYPYYTRLRCEDARYHIE